LGERRLAWLVLSGGLIGEPARRAGGCVNPRVKPGDGHEAVESLSDSPEPQQSLAEKQNPR